MRHIAAAILLAAPPQVLPQRCESLAGLAASAPFARYPAATPRRRWRAPDVRHGEAHLFRTALRDAMRGPPTFAGRYGVAEIGCGAGAVCPAFVDRANGRVRFVPSLRVVAELGGRIADAGIDDARLTYRRDSRLLVVIGAPNEVEARAGVHLYDWRRGAPRLVRFVPAAALCEGRSR